MVSRFEIKFRNFASSVIGVRDYNINNNDDISKKALLYDFNGAVEQGWKIIKYYLEYVQNFMSVIERLYGIISELRVKYMKYWEKDMIDA